MKFSKIVRITIITIVIFALIWVISFIKHMVSKDVMDAAVDEESGNIAVLYRDYKIKVYNTDGEIIYSMVLSDNAGGYASLEYVNGLLNVQMFRTDVIKTIDDKGQVIESTIYMQEEENYEWDGGWVRENDAYYYHTDSFIYRYTYPTYFDSLVHKNDIVFEIVNKDTQKTIILQK